MNDLPLLTNPNIAGLLAADSFSPLTTYVNRSLSFYDDPLYSGHDVKVQSTIGNPDDLDFMLMVKSQMAKILRDHVDEQTLRSLTEGPLLEEINAEYITFGTKKVLERENLLCHLYQLDLDTHFPQINRTTHRKTFHLLDKTNPLGLELFEDEVIIPSLYLQFGVPKSCLSNLLTISPQIIDSPQLIEIYLSNAYSQIYGEEEGRSKLGRIDWPNFTLNFLNWVNIKHNAGPKSFIFAFEQSSLLGGREKVSSKVNYIAVTSYQ